MLQQILADMYIEPELLTELNEEQKQILFFKMREEQIRRWRETEMQLEEEEAARVKVKKVSGKTVSWMKGLDDDVWVWVMGEHPEDKPYDQICDRVMAERAALQAQREAEKLRPMRGGGHVQKSKAADVRRRSLAKQSIEDHRRRSVKALERGRVAAMTKAFGSTNPAPAPKPRNTSNTSSAISRKGGMRRSLSASSRDHIIRWFKEEQLPLRAGFQRDQSRIAPWFHASENCYMLLGDQIRFSSLTELLEYHQVNVPYVTHWSWGNGFIWARRIPKRLCILFLQVHT
ncbi:SH2 domain-containing protein 4A-like [Sinocyclocheilus grahami]|uniref:SH2 domain-containing protein 4A-like n=1 Tax=Sinocyclocheilus grahami TaxID=75366 RepID=UPI0007ACBAD4|nr:PREDICTED: SH2 domain-containing protein 4A-like [Sinocyclocheilus grahami]